MVLFYLSFSIGSNQPVPSASANDEGSVLKEDLAGRANAKVGNVDIECVFPLGILFVDGRLGTRELGTLPGSLGGRGFVLGGPFGCLAGLEQPLSFLVAQLFAILVVCQLNIIHKNIEYSVCVCIVYKEIK